MTTKKNRILFQVIVAVQNFHPARCEAVRLVAHAAVMIGIEIRLPTHLQRTCNALVTYPFRSEFACKPTNSGPSGPVSKSQASFIRLPTAYLHFSFLVNTKHPALLLLLVVGWWEYFLWIWNRESVNCSSCRVVRCLLTSLPSMSDVSYVQ